MPLLLDRCYNSASRLQDSRPKSLSSYSMWASSNAGPSNHLPISETAAGKRPVIDIPWDFAELKDPSKYVGLSCVSVACDPEGGNRILARVSIVDYRGRILLNTFVYPIFPVANYLEQNTGISPDDLASGVDFFAVQAKVVETISDKIIIGHSLWNDFNLLGLSHPAIDTRDLALFLPFRKVLKMMDDIPDLPLLIHYFMNRKIRRQTVEPIEEARAAVDLFRSCEEYWEKIVESGEWPSALPPRQFSHYFT